MEEIDETTLNTSKNKNTNMANSYKLNDRSTKNNKNKSRSNLEIEV